MASHGTSPPRDPRIAETLSRFEASWVPVFLARAALGLGSVVVVSVTADAAGNAVAVLAPAEASALLKKLGDTKGSAKVAGTPTPGATWGVGVLPDGHLVWALAMTPILTRGAG